MSRQPTLTRYGVILLPALTAITVVFDPSLGFTAIDDSFNEENASQQIEAPRARAAVPAQDHFDLLIFRRNVNMDAIRSQFKIQFETKLHELDRLCQLTATQKEKLTLASLGDIKRFLDQVDEARAKYSTMVAQGQLPPEVMSLRNKANNNLFEGGSFYEKALPNVLSSEQLTTYNDTRYQKSIDLAFSSSKLRRSIALKHEQQESLKQLLIEQTLPPRVFGKKEYDFYVVMRQLSKLPPEKIQSLLDERQWKMLQQELTRCAAREKELIHEGLIPSDN